MFKNIYSKTFYEKRFMLIGWSIGIFAMTMLTMCFYPYLKGSNFDAVLQSVPKAFQGLLGNTESYRTVTGYAAQQIFAFRLPLLTIIMSIALFAGMSAGDENKGTVETLLAQPVSRLRVFWEKFAAGATVTFIATMVIIFGIVASFPVIHGSMSFGRLFEASIGCWLISLAFGSLAYAVGSITGKKGPTIGLTSAIAFGSYLISSMAPLVSNLDSAQKLTAFYYYNTPSIAEKGVDIGHVGVLIVTIGILLLVGVSVFTRRDLTRGE